MSCLVNRKLGLWAVEEIVGPLCALGLSVVQQVLELAAATVAPAWQLAKRTSTALTQLALSTAAASAEMAASVSALIAGVSREVSVLILSALAAARSVAQEVQLTVLALLGWGVEAPSGPVVAQPSPSTDRQQ